MRLSLLQIVSVRGQLYSISYFKGVFGGGKGAFAPSNPLAPPLVIHTASNTMFHESIKHIGGSFDFDFVQEKVESGIIATVHTSKGDQVLNMVMKPL